MGLPNDWLSGDAGLYREALPLSWEGSTCSGWAVWEADGVRCRSGGSDCDEVLRLRHALRISRIFLT